VVSLNCRYHKINQITRRHIPEGLITNDLNGVDFISRGLNRVLRLPILTNVSNPNQTIQFTEQGEKIFAPKSSRRVASIKLN